MRIDTPTNASAPRSAPKRTPHSAGRGTRHIARLLAAVFGFVAVCTDGLAVAASLTGKPLVQQDKPLVVVSIGDSYSSGEGLEEFEKEVAPDGDTAEAERIIAHRSLQSWPGQLIFTDASGATVQLKDCYCPQALDDTPGQNAPRTLTGRERRGVYWYSAAASPDYVTVTFGGNDANFSEVVAACIALPKGNTLEKLLDDIWEEFYDGTRLQGSIQTRLRDLYTQVCATAGPQASVIVAGYPPLLSAGGLLISSKEAKLVNDSIREFNRQIELLVTSCREEQGLNIYYVSVEEEFAGHEAYTSDPYLFPVVFNGDIDSFKDLTQKGLVHYRSMHPNEKGVAAYARCVQKKIDELEQAKKAQKQTRYPAVYRAPRILFDIPKHHYELTA